MKKNIIQVGLIGLVLLPLKIYAGGGWVGNGIGSETSTLSEFGFGDEDSSEPRETNYFLLKDGERSLTLGMIWIPEKITETVGTLGNLPITQTRTRYETIPAILFSWGLSKNWTWSNYLSLRYNLYSAGRNDIALSFGPAEGGFGHENASGFYMAPGASILHSYYLGLGFRLINELSVNARYQTKKDADNSHFSFNAASLLTTLSKTFADTFTLSLGGLTYAGYRRESLNNRVQKNWKWYVLGSSPKIGASVALGKQAELGLNVSLDRKSLARAGGPTTLLYLETRF